MKSKKLPIIVISIIAVVLVVIAGVFFLNRNSDYTIPDGYLHKFTSYLSNVDGPDTDYYVYSDKIIVEENLYYPSGHPSNTTHTRKITLYENLTPEVNSLEDVLTAIKDQQGKVVLDTKE